MEQESRLNFDVAKTKPSYMLKTPKMKIYFEFIEKSISFQIIKMDGPKSGGLLFRIENQNSQCEYKYIEYELSGSEEKLSLPSIDILESSVFLYHRVFDINNGMKVMILDRGLCYFEAIMRIYASIPEVYEFFYSQTFESPFLNEIKKVLHFVNASISFSLAKLVCFMNQYHACITQFDDPKVYNMKMLEMINAAMGNSNFSKIVGIIESGFTVKPDFRPSVFFVSSQIANQYPFLKTEYVMYREIKHNQQHYSFDRGFSYITIFRRVESMISCNFEIPDVKLWEYYVFGDHSREFIPSYYHKFIPYHYFNFPWRKTIFSKENPQYKIPGYYNFSFNKTDSNESVILIPESYSNHIPSFIIDSNEYFFDGIQARTTDNEYFKTKLGTKEKFKALDNDKDRLNIKYTTKTKGVYILKGKEPVSFDQKPFCIISIQRNTSEDYFEIPMNEKNVSHIINEYQLDQYDAFMFSNNHFTKKLSPDSQLRSGFIRFLPKCDPIIICVIFMENGLKSSLHDSMIIGFVEEPSWDQAKDRIYCELNTRGLEINDFEPLPPSHDIQASINNPFRSFIALNIKNPNF